jgi:hypothetical protein
MSFLKKLFGGRSEAAPASAPTEEHKGFTIRATPIAEGGQFRVCGMIIGEQGGERREFVFQRADRMSSREEAVGLTFQKGRQIIDEQGARLFT